MNLPPLRSLTRPAAVPSLTALARRGLSAGRWADKPKGIPWPYPSDGAFIWCRDIALPQMKRGEAWHWTMRTKVQPAQLFGLVSLMTKEDDNRSFWVATGWQGQGFASEAADAVTTYWFDVLKFPVLRAAKAVANVASRRISERQGMRVVRTEMREYISGQLPTEVVEITADEWRARRQDSTP